MHYQSTMCSIALPCGRKRLRNRSGARESSLMLLVQMTNREKITTFSQVKTLRSAEVGVCQFSNSFWTRIQPVQADSEKRAHDLDLKYLLGSTFTQLLKSHKEDGRSVVLVVFKSFWRLYGFMRLRWTRSCPFWCGLSWFFVVLVTLSCLIRTLILIHFNLILAMEDIEKGMFQAPGE